MLMEPPGKRLNPAGSSPTEQLMSFKVKNLEERKKEFAIQTTQIYDNASDFFDALHTERVQRGNQATDLWNVMPSNQLNQFKHALNSKYLDSPEILQSQKMAISRYNHVSASIISRFHNHIILGVFFDHLKR